MNKHLKKVVIFCLLFFVVLCSIKIFTTNKYNYPIDLVYLWVDGSDPVWQAKKEATLKKYPVQEVYSKGAQR